MANVDAPETAHDKRGAQRGGDEAAKYVSERVLGKEITLDNVGSVKVILLPLKSGVMRVLQMLKDTIAGIGLRSTL